MNIDFLIEKFSHSRKYQEKGIFSTLFIVQNKLQTLFDKSDPYITLKQFMLVTMIGESEEQLTFTQLGTLLGCSRQNIKKLASSLEQKGFVKIEQVKNDTRAATVLLTEKFHSYVDKVSLSHQKKLDILFSNYTDEETKILYTLLMRLHNGTENITKELENE